MALVQRLTRSTASKRALSRQAKTASHRRRTASRTTAKRKRAGA